MKRRPVAEYNFLIRAPRAEDRRHFWTMCRKLGWRHDTVPRAIAGYIRREIRRAHIAERPPDISAVRARILVSVAGELRASLRDRGYVVTTLADGRRTMAKAGYAP